MIIDVYAKDFKKDIEGFGKPKCIEVPAMPCKVSFDIGGKVDEADYNLIRSRLMDSMTKSQVVEKFEVEVHKITQTSDNLAAALLVTEPKKVDEVLKSYRTSVQAAVAKFESAVADDFKTAWNKLIEDRAKYKAYKVKAAIDFTVNVVSLAGSIAGLATAATPAAPVTAVMGAYGIVKSLSKLCIQCRNLYVEAETIAKDVDKDVVALKAKVDKRQKEVDAGTADSLAQAKKDKKVVKVKELGVAVGNKLFGDIVTVFVASIDGATKKNGQYGNKIRGIQEATVGYTKDYLAMTGHLNEMHKYLLALDGEYQVFVAKVGYSPVAQPFLAKRQKQIKTAFDAWSGATKAMVLMNDTVAGSEKRYQDNLARQKKFQAGIDEAEKAFKTKNWAEAGRWIGVVAEAGLSVGPSGAGAWDSANAIVGSVMKLVTIAEKEAITELKKKF